MDSNYNGKSTLYSLFFPVLFLINLQCFGQKPDVFIGMNANLFHDYKAKQGHYSSSYKLALGYTAGLGLDIIKKDRFKLRITVQYDHYNGISEVSDGGLGGGYTTYANVNKSIVSLGLFPVRFRFLKKIDVNFGLLFSGLIDESFSGNRLGWKLNSPPVNVNLLGMYKHFSSKTNVGCQLRFSREFELSNSVLITPQYMFYYGLLNEFRDYIMDANSVRHYFCIGFKKKIN